MSRFRQLMSEIGSCEIGPLENAIEPNTKQTNDYVKLNRVRFLSTLVSSNERVIAEG